MKRIQIILVVLLVLILLITGCTKQPLVDTKEEVPGVQQDIDNTESSRIRGLALELMQFQQNNLGFRLAGTDADLESAEYINQKMQDIGLHNVTKDEIILDSWKYSEPLLVLEDCDCNEERRLEIKTLGINPININLQNEKVTVVSVGYGGEEYYKGKEVKNKAVLIESPEKLQENIDIASSKGVKLIMVNSGLMKGLSAKTLENIVSDLPILEVSQNTVDILKKYSTNAEIEVTLTLQSVVNEDVPTYTVWGDIVGKNQNEVIYITINRDSLYRGFMSTGVGVGQLLRMAEKMVEEGYKPKSTIRFVVTTGQEWGKKGLSYNEGIKAQLEKRPDWLGNAKAVIVLDGSKPIAKSIYTMTMVNNDIRDFVTEYNENFKTKGYRFVNTVVEHDNSRVTEANVWLDKGINTILLGEPVQSGYLRVENTTEDSVNQVIDEVHVQFLLDYYIGLIKEMDASENLLTGQ